MGDAYTSMADDEYTLFYNPATLARHKGFSFTPLNIQLSATNVIDGTEQFENVGDSVDALIDAGMDYPVYVNLGYNPTFKMGRFGFSAIINMDSSLILLNEVNPMLNIDHRYDKGFVAGYGIPFNKNFALGLSAKYFQRQSLFGQFNVVSQTVIDAIDNDDYNDIIKELGLVDGSGWGLDLGFEYLKVNRSSTLSFGLSVIDLLNSLQTDSNDDELEVQQQDMKVNLGGSYKFKYLPGLNATFSADIRNLEETDMDFRQRLRLGVALGITPALELLAGMDGGGYSYGAMLNSGGFKLYGGFYSKDVVSTPGEELSDRVLIYLSLFDFTFDG